MTARSGLLAFTNQPGVRQGIGYAILAGAVWLAWEVVKAPVVQRGAPSLAIRLAPKSPEVLRRAAEGELDAGRVENAETLASDSLVRGPFNSRAMRIRGLAEARLGDVNRADEMLTLAGNWSLRDDPAHAWLVEHRLRRGDYGSSFAHADTLARRRADLHPSLFSLFETAANQDARALPVLVRLLATNPPWRPAFLEYLHQSKTGESVIGALAISLQDTNAPFTAHELERLYIRWLAQGRLVGIRQVRETLERPSMDSPLQNGDFSTNVDSQSYPFGWTLGGGIGLTTDVTQDDLDPSNLAYRAEYDGFSAASVLEQLIMLPPGEYLFEGLQRVETGPNDLRLEWQMTCAETATTVSIYRPSTQTGTVSTWKPFSAPMIVPRTNCTVQWLRLVGRPGESRTSIAIWYDNIRIKAVSGSHAATPSQ